MALFVVEPKQKPQGQSRGVASDGEGAADELNYGGGGLLNKKFGIFVLI